MYILFLNRLDEFYLPSEFGVIIIILKIQFFFRLKNQVRDFWFVLFDRS